MRKSRERYASIVRVSFAIGGLLVLFMGYVVLTSTLTGMSYAVAKAHQQREALARGDDAARRPDRRAAVRRTPLGNGRRAWA